MTYYGDNQDGFWQRWSELKYQDALEVAERIQLAIDDKLPEGPDAVARIMQQCCEAHMEWLAEQEAENETEAV